MGQLKRTPAARRIAIALWAVAALGLIAGCGGKDEAEPVVQESRQAMTPAAEDTAVADTLSVAPAPVTEQDTLKAVAPSSVGSAEASAGSPVHRPQPSAGKGGYSLQLGSFRSVDNARAQVERIQGLGLKPTVEVATLGGQTYHRVVLHGPADRSEAERLGEHIRSQLGITYLIRQE